MHRENENKLSIYKISYLAPCLPPLFGLMKTRRGLDSGNGVMSIGIPS